MLSANLPPVLKNNAKVNHRFDIGGSTCTASKLGFGLDGTIHPHQTNPLRVPLLSAGTQASSAESAVSKNALAMAG